MQISLSITSRKAPDLINPAQNFSGGLKKPRFMVSPLPPIILEATHRLMMCEASSVIDMEMKNLPKYLKQHSELVKQLTKHLAIPGAISRLNVEMIPVTAGLIEESQVLKPKYGFLSNDTLTLQVMDEYKITSLASNDMDFKRVDWVRLYLPFSANDKS